MRAFVVDHVTTVFVIIAAVSWLAAIVGYLGPDCYRYWQERHTRWLKDE